MSPRDALEALYALKAKAAAGRLTCSKWLAALGLLAVPCRSHLGARAILSDAHHHPHGDRRGRRRDRRGGARDRPAALAEAWGQQVVIENKGGAAHVVGAQSVAKAAPDGYSLLVAEAGTFTINPTLYGKGKLPYDEEKDFIPITGIVRINQALLGHPSLAGRHGERADRARQSASRASSPMAPPGSDRRRT